VTWFLTSQIVNFDWLQDLINIGWIHTLQILTSQIIDKQVDKLKFGIYIYGNENNFMEYIYIYIIMEFWFDVVRFKE
jgi:hypothetical protein